jgi:hypothetical protein
MRLIFLAAFSCFSLAAQVCNPTDLSGAYGFQLSGTATNSGRSVPIAAIGRLVFDSDGHISGNSSVNFNGYLLSNPVTGTYEFKPDCTLTWSLQDDSGAWQHFRGLAQAGARRASFRQTDPGSDGHGDLRRTATTCSAAAFHGGYFFGMGGVTTPFSPQAAHLPTTQRTETAADGNGGLFWKSGEAANTGTYTVDSDCFMQINFGLPLRGILVDDGRVVLAIQTNPEQVGVATFIAQ